MSEKFTTVLATIIVSVFPVFMVLANEPSAIVEDYRGNTEGIEVMQIMQPGQVFELNVGDVLVLGYFTSCIRETISGGTVTIGVEESKVSRGKRKSEDVDCDGGIMIGPSSNRKEAAAAVFRKGQSKKRLPKPDWTLFGTSPLFRLEKFVERIEILRMDKSGEPIVIEVNGKVVDAAKKGIRLERSGFYEVKIGKVTFYLKISPLAEPDAPMLSRLIVFGMEAAN